MQNYTCQVSQSPSVGDNREFCDSHLPGKSGCKPNALYAKATDMNVTREEPSRRRRDDPNAPKRLKLEHATTTEEHVRVGAHNKRKERRRRRRRGRRRPTEYTVSLEGVSRTNVCSMRRASGSKGRKDQRAREFLHIATFARTSALMICCIVATTVRGQNSLANTKEPATGSNPIAPNLTPETAPSAANSSTASPQPSSPPLSTPPPTSEKISDRPSRFPSTAPSTPEPTQGASQPPSSVPSTTMAPTPLPSFVPSVYPSAAPSTPHEEAPLPPEDITKALSIGFSVPIVLFAVASLLFLARRRLVKRDAAAAAAKVNTPVTIIKEIPPGIEHLDDLKGNNARSRTVHSADDNPIKQNESMVSLPSLESTNPSVDVDTDYSNTRGNSVPGGEENSVEIRAVEENYVATQDVRSMNTDDDAQGVAADYSTSRVSQDVKTLMWGTADGDHMAIEASVLCETNDWLKRNSGAGRGERRNFAQQLVKRMVASVSFNVIAPKDASRTIHEAVAMLGLPLGVDVDVPRTTLLVSGMPKNVTRQDVVDAFQRFGVLEGAAVSPNERGFGLVRYLSKRSVRRAMDRFRTDEINVQDVAVDIRALSHCFPERNSQVQFAV